jgi:fluoroquinolone resistance protein
VDDRTRMPPPATTSTVDATTWDPDALSGTSHDGVLFVDIDLADVEVRGASFAGCTFRDIRFNASTHVDGAFTNCTFVGCSFFDARLQACKLVGSTFDGCSFDLLVADGGDWSLVGLAGADLRKATMRRLRLREADLSGATLDGADVRECDLSGAWLRGTSLRGTDLRGSDLSAIDPRTTDLRDARIDPEQAMTIAAALGMRIG